MDGAEAGGAWFARPVERRTVALLAREPQGDAPGLLWRSLALLTDLDMEVVAVEPIARFFGYAYDGMAGVLDVDTLETRQERDRLHEIERTAMPRYPGICKYTYMAARV